MSEQKVSLKIQIDQYIVDFYMQDYRFNCVLRHEGDDIQKSNMSAGHHTVYSAYEKALNNFISAKYPHAIDDEKYPSSNALDICKKVEEELKLRYALLYMPV